MSLFPSRIGIEVHQTGSLLQILRDIVVDRIHRLTWLTLILCIGLALYWNGTISANKQKISKRLLKFHLSDGIFLNSIGDIVHGRDMAFGIVGTRDKTITTFPKGICDIGLPLEITCTECAEEPIGTCHIL